MESYSETLHTYYYILTPYTHMHAMGSIHNLHVLHACIEFSRPWLARARGTLIFMCDTTNFEMWHDSGAYAEVSLYDVCGMMPHSCVSHAHMLTWPMCHMLTRPHPYVRPLIHMLWVIDVRHDSFLCDITHSCGHDSYICDMTHS